MKHIYKVGDIVEIVRDNGDHYFKVGQRCKLIRRSTFCKNDWIGDFNGCGNAWVYKTGVWNIGQPSRKNTSYGFKLYTPVTKVDTQVAKLVKDIEGTIKKLNSTIIQLKNLVNLVKDK